MLSFGWKQQNKHSKRSSDVFQQSNDEDVLDDSVDWLTATKRPKLLVLEDAKIKAERLREEGIVMASEERWWSAIGRWNSSLKFGCSDHTVHEMLAQAYMQVGEVFPALKSAEKAVELAPTWWIGHQTLGRAQLGLGEVSLAVKSISRAVHLNPDDRDLWTQDLKWAVSLLEKHKEVCQSNAKNSTEDEFSLVEVNDEKAKEFISENIASKPAPDLPPMISKRYMSRILKQIPKLSDQPQIDISSSSQVINNELAIDNCNSLVKFRINR